MQPESPINRLPPVVIVLTLLIVGIECVFQLANYGMIGGPRGVGWRFDAIEQYGFSTAVLDRVLVNADYSFDILKRFVTYPFINIDLTQVAFCAALTLALGKFTAEYYGGTKILIVYVLTSIVGALVFGLLANTDFPLLGGYTPVYGLIGAYTYALWLRLGEAGDNQILAFRLIGFLLLIQLIFGIVASFLYETPPPPTWISELSGFVAGFGLAVLLAPGGWTSFVARMRQRS
ncbi:rhomboid family intramembrane serine protease [Cognatiyoonia sp. IB215182]|uniref:rhomboid family intramembrane serine protease n=1 Tax=Cognatiyoonia sp. IB215182 TaxID=3097353 RepID=UPI002A15E3D3|nr:rhomboid family intramembrane serine protease [Cognatiyoonia sp. IB215182]MDX8351728.1 rhomboid family intramembrane serine protease [Cognatiyoonia sp. IB215182]